MTTTQAVGVALILLGVAYAVVWVGWLRRRGTEPATPDTAASEESAVATTDVSDVPVPEPAASEESVAEAPEISDATPEPEPAPEPAPVASASLRHRTTEDADATEGEEAVDVAQGVPGRYLGTTSLDGDVAKDLTRAGDATLTIAYGALAWRPAKGTALRAQADELAAVDGLDVGRAGADTPLTVRWHPPAAPGATYETRFVPTTPADRAALADALRALRPDLTTSATTSATTPAPVPEETA